jgi:hypothetical protein
VDAQRERPTWDARLTISTVQKQDRVSAAENGNQAQVHLRGVGLLGVRHKLDIAIVAATARGCRLSDRLLFVRHVEGVAQYLRTCVLGVTGAWSQHKLWRNGPLGANG